MPTRTVRGLICLAALGFLSPAISRAEEETGISTFLIPDLWPGTWTVTVELDERESSTRVRILPQDEAVRIDLVLEADPE